MKTIAELGEPQRTDNLRSYSILDTPPEGVFDGLTQLASRLCDAPIAWISFLDGSREWIKSKVGIDIVEISRAVSFCAHTILESKALVVSDARSDRRFAANPLVRSEPFIRFYAGVPLTSPEGFTLGSLCVIDHQPRGVTADQLDSLEVLAQHIMRELVSRRVQLEQERMIDDLQRAKEALSETEDLAENSRDLIQSLALDGRLTYVNRAWCETLGYNPNEALNLTIWDILDSNSIRPCKDILRRLASGEKIDKWDALLIAKDGKHIAVESTMNCRFAQGRPVAVRCILRDVTARNVEERRRRDAEQQYTRLFHDALEGIVQIGLKGELLSVNPSMARILGYDSPQDFIVCHNERHYPLYVDRAERNKLVATLQRKGRIRGYECRLFRKNGTVVWVRGSGRMVRGPGRCPLFFEGVVSDITEEKRFRSALRESEERFRTLAEHAQVAIFQADAEGRRTYVNERWCEMTGLTADEALGSKWLETIHPDDRTRVAQLWESAVKRGSNYTPEYRFLRKDGQVAWAQASAVPVRDSSGKTVGYVGTVIDLTDRKKFEEQLSRTNISLERQNRQIEEANRLKTQFLANMSHELRTPLNSVIGFAELIQDEVVGPVSTDQKQFLEDILGSARHLLQLINDLLDISKIEAGRMEFRPETVDLFALISEVTEILRPQASMKQLKIGVQIEDPLRAVFVDPAKLKQVLFNYVSNAVKFTPEGGKIDVSVRAETDDQFRLEVVDSGIGIDSADLPRLFVEFQQLDLSLSKEYQGTGLGLALTKRLVERQGGRVGVQSRLGAGSTFFAVLPRRTAAIGAVTLEQNTRS